MTRPYDPISDEEPLEISQESLEAEQGRHWPRWLFLVLGVAIGVTLGLIYTWGLNPVEYYDTEPVDLRPQYKETWILLVAAAYRQDGDLERALSRLSGLDDPEIGGTVADITERAINAGRSATRIRALAGLADALGARTDQMMIYLATPAPTLFFAATPLPPAPTVTPQPTPTNAPTATGTAAPAPTATVTPTNIPTLRPTRTRRPTATRPPPFYVERRQRICQPDQDAPRIEVVVQTEDGTGVPGIEIWVTWTGGADRFVTGLKPEKGLGYADFEMSPDVIYDVAIGDPSLKVVSGLRPERCDPGDSNADIASWRLTIIATSAAITPTPPATETPAETSTPTRFVRPTATMTATRTATATTTPTATSTPVFRPTATATPTATSNPTATEASTATPTATTTPTVTATPTTTTTATQSVQ